jgi:hypothetical protein
MATDKDEKDSNSTTELAKDVKDDKPVVASFSPAHKSSNKITLIIALIIIVLIVIVGAFYFTSNRLTSYNFTNAAGSNYQIKFFTKATVKQFGFGSVETQPALVSPAITKGGVPIAITMGGFTNNTANLKASLSSLYNKCPIPGTEKAFTETVTSLNLKALVCTDKNVYYYSYFGNQASIFFIQIAPFTDSFTISTSAYPTSITASAPTIKDVKTIVSSFKYISTTKTKTAVQD